MGLPASEDSLISQAREQVKEPEKISFSIDGSTACPRQETRPQKLSAKGYTKKINENYHLDQTTRKSVTPRLRTSC